MNELSERQLQILQLIADGYPPKSTAYILGISYKTVTNHLNNIYRILNVHTCVHAIVVCMRKGLIQ